MASRNGTTHPSAAPLRIGRVTVAQDRPCVILAEGACEHQGRLAAAKQLARAAKAAGADIVKFQLHLPELEMLPKTIKFWAGSMDEILEQVNLSIEDHRRLMRYCEQIGIQYLCTAYCAAGVDALQAMGIAAFKIGSGEMTNLPMMRRVASISSATGKPVIVSTGMCTEQEIAETAAVFKAQRAPFMLLNCTSEYPPKYEHLHLGFMDTLRRRFKVLVGHSDHSPDNYSSFGAAALGAKMLEKHFTLAHRNRGPDWHVSLEPQGLRDLVTGVRRIEAALGAEKRLYPEERPVRRWAHHSVVSVQDIPRGSTMTSTMVDVKRPGYGIPAKYLETVCGRVARRAIPANTLIRWADLSPSLKP